LRANIHLDFSIHFFIVFGAVFVIFRKHFILCNHHKNHDNQLVDRQLPPTEAGDAVGRDVGAADGAPLGQLRRADHVDPPRRADDPHRRAAQAARPPAAAQGRRQAVSSFFP